MKNDALENIKSYASDQSLTEIVLGLGHTRKSNFSQVTNFQGFLISEFKTTIWDEDIDPTHPAFVIPISYQTQRLYYSETTQTLLVYLLDEYPDTDPNGYKVFHGSIYEVQNLRNFIDSYPKLANKVGLPVPLPPDVLPLDEAIEDII